MFDQENPIFHKRLNSNNKNLLVDFQRILHKMKAVIKNEQLHKKREKKIRR